MSYDTDSYGQVINGPNTFRTAAHDVMENSRMVVLNWADEAGTLLNVLLAFEVR